MEHRKFVSMVPIFHRDRLELPLKRRIKPSRVFVTIAGDLLCPGFKDDEIQAVIDVVRKCHEEGKGHIFFFLTKKPARYKYFDFPPNAWCGTSITGDDANNRLGKLIMNTERNRYASIEPFLECPLYCDGEFYGIDWLIIGGRSGKKPFKPPAEWVAHVLQGARRANIPVFLKHNTGYTPLIQQFPAEIIMPWEKGINHG